MSISKGILLRTERRKQNLTLRQLSEKTGIDYSMLSKYENGIIDPPKEKLRIIQAALNIPGTKKKQNEGPAMTIGEKIRFLRKTNGMTQTDLARKLHVSKQTIGKYEQGIVTNIPLDKIKSLTTIFGVSEGYITGWETSSEASDFTFMAALKKKLCCLGWDIYSDSAESIIIAKDSKVIALSEEDLEKLESELSLYMEFLISKIEKAEYR